MKLNEESIRWAIEHIYIEGDTDLFPKPKEIDIIYENKESVLQKLSNIDLSNYNWNPSRRFVIPKTELSYRVATQLDPIDSIVLAAIIYEFGENIENRRIPIEHGSVFNYRFSPNELGYLYSGYKSWTEFWEMSLAKSMDFNYVVYVDIADFYNQIYHHVIENQLIQSGIPNVVKKSIMNLLGSVTQGVSRGIPVGPHSVHILAEMALIPVDNSLSGKGIDFCRYADDIVIFCNEETEAHKLIYELASTLDKQQRLILQNQKTKIYNREEFLELCNDNLTKKPVDNLEGEIISLLQEYISGGYGSNLLTEIPEEKMSIFSEENIKNLLDKYLKSDNPNFSRIRWLFRKLSIVGTPNAINYISLNIDRLFPALNDICKYFISVANKQNSPLHEVGEELYNLLDHEIIKVNDFCLISILSLFTNTKHFNHINKVIGLYRGSSEMVKRKIILAAFESNQIDWIRELKEDYPRMDLWSKRALLIAASNFPADERKFYLNGIKMRLGSNEILERILIDASNKAILV